MKKILSISAIIVFTFGLFLTSCNSSSRLCPAYPPSVYQGDAGDINTQDINIEVIKINEDL